jgi:hypothetical protein
MNIKKILCVACVAFTSFGTSILNASPTHTPDIFLNTPAGTKITFIKDFKIPPNEMSVMVGKYTKGNMITECSLNMIAYDSGLRMIPAGTKFEVKDTAFDYQNKAHVVLKSNSIRSIDCSTYKNMSGSSWLPSENDMPYTKYSEAKAALGNKVKVEISSSPKLIKD